MDDTTSGIRGNVLLTGGAGYIGIHCCIALLQAGWNPVVFDNLSNGWNTAPDAVAQITGTRPDLVVGDIRDPAALDAVMGARQFSAVLHLAGAKAVKASLADPVTYYANNVAGTLTLLEAMEKHGLRKLVFSSSAAVYGQPQQVPVTEDARLDPLNPYARTKAMVETVLRDLQDARPEWAIAALRYFNPVGAHESALVGERSRVAVDNLMPWILKAADGAIPHVDILGSDYPTPDGTCIRDFVHVMDVAEGHVAALYLLEKEQGYHAINLGMGHGTSVLDMVRTFEGATGRTVPWRMAPRRVGDIAATWADITRAGRLLGWKPRRSLEVTCRDAWRWYERSRSA
ncbi:UDP-glucose 4-epimerase GalE [Zhengella mangrovi]|uniref:UDP-glucose 4-epimerase n=1 Tax=Zhengella mangrovi TaxID=1982044 RepID=A0A2G1QHG0_9HYPH|nr:UDP-glucose 4-epimerase GalE [Zhengella mangrovi]PHP64668.1 UDP-glucose 4-epimerase GalE [Zhengella mangrovi]